MAFQKIEHSKVLISMGSIVLLLTCLLFPNWEISHRDLREETSPLIRSVNKKGQLQKYKRFAARSQLLQCELLWENVILATSL